ncbi:DUF721 domain-containing protein [Prochlorococcus marinus]|uniref:DUF721 domain-containing protein n=1 Tax=Prochlorococcus marinus (strain MIT 9211) TaxID=93059 RepID=A9BE49_PROM4|nr:DUF721 domain-containing protein [Prochlorococcus marinus]ABX08359.1 conserved hypothetical protein [Prochlorococcus marinus str. MIT 9211]
MNSANDRPLSSSSQEKLLKEGIPNTPSSLIQCLEDVKQQLHKNQKIAALWQDWPKIAGKDLAEHCTPLTINRGVLIIGASHPQWIQALIFNRNQLLAALKAKGHQVKALKVQSHYPVKHESKEAEQLVWGKHPSRVDIHGVANCSFCNGPAPAGEISLWGKCGLCRRKDLFEKKNP